MFNLVFPSASAKYELASRVKQTSMVINMQMYTILLDAISQKTSVSMSSFNLQGNACDKEKEIQNSPNYEIN